MAQLRGHLGLPVECDLNFRADKTLSHYGLAGHLDRISSGRYRPSLS
nr:DUF2958 domain-containing protein [Methylomarinum sp. Ch1-1]MDP4523086.1 DUF2958 domain-containing protein [Methylomarinum sp. Ch1-1]